MAGIEINGKPMQPKIVIRSEKAADLDAIRDVTVSAFKTLAISGYPEQFIIAALRAAQALTVPLVAEVDGRFAFARLCRRGPSPSMQRLKRMAAR
jgi:hypothetical protein